MRRRDFMTLVGGAATAWPLAARAQQAQRTRRVGVLIGFAETDPDVKSWFAAFRGALAKLGWTEGSNLQIVAWRRDTPSGAACVELAALAPRAATLNESHVVHHNKTERRLMTAPRHERSFQEGR